MLIDFGWLWLLIDCWLILIDADWFLLILIDSDWFWLILIDSGWFWWILIDSDWIWLILIDADWCWLMMIEADWFWERPGSYTSWSTPTSLGRPFFSTVMGRCPGVKLCAVSNCPWCQIFCGVKLSVVSNCSKILLWSKVVSKVVAVQFVCLQNSSAQRLWLISDYHATDKTLCKL